MNSITSLMRQSDLEIQKILEDSVREKENQLRQLRQILQEALSLVDHVLEDSSQVAPLGDAEGTPPGPTVREVVPTSRTRTAAAAPASQPISGNDDAVSEFP